MNTRSTFKSFAFALAGLLLSLVYTLAVGLLTVQAIGIRDGASIDLNNTVAGIIEPHVPYLQMISVAFLGILVAYFLFFGSHKQESRNRMAMTVGFSIGTVALLVYAFAGIEVSNVNVSVVDSSLTGWKGWVYVAGNDSSLHLLLGLTLGWILLRVLPSGKATQHEEVVVNP